ncbi:tyrosine-type recombinase/integrase [Salipaludibacillus sp. HK11]|uniref:tyrosine-type recombinase/integrase n=1 Tax=Salipaludibacillus sp. HK11 TaxID=3394320 RepID=UPI0039FBFA14
MTKKLGLFDVSLETEIGKPKDEKTVVKGTDAKFAFKTIARQMELNGLRQRTIQDYQMNFDKFLHLTKTTYLEEINTDTIYLWLSSINVSPQTKLTRLKCIKAILGKCFNNGWFKTKFWLNIQIKVDKHVKKGADKNDLNLLISLLDTSTFIGLRDAVAILTLQKTGIRIFTLGEIKESHIDFQDKSLILGGDVMKNHNHIKLPLDDKLINLYQILINLNHKIRTYYMQDNEYLFIGRRGKRINNKSSNNTISRQLSKYSQRYNLDNINAHAIRRSYAKNLYDKKASVALISKALGHANLSVTTQYLDLEVNEVAESLRDYL